MNLELCNFVHLTNASNNLDLGLFKMFLSTRKQWFRLGWKSLLVFGSFQNEFEIRFLLRTRSFNVFEPVSSIPRVTPYGRYGESEGNPSKHREQTPRSAAACSSPEPRPVQMRIRTYDVRYVRHVFLRFPIRICYWDMLKRLESLTIFHVLKSGDTQIWFQQQNWIDEISLQRNTL